MGDDLFLGDERLRLFLESLARKHGFSRPTPVFQELLRDDYRRRSKDVHCPQPFRPLS